MIILGSTGSIGKNTLEIAERFNLEIETLVAGENYQLLNQQIKKFHPKIVAVKNSETAQKINHNNIFIGENGILEALEKSKSNLVVNSLVGFSGLKPTLKTLELGKKLALANKESLVLAGAFLDMKKIFPIDSEHFGLWYLLQGHNSDEVQEMTLTASGGAFRDWEIEKIASATPKDALKHPNWSMGQKITIDSATMVNKLFEILEAKWLFQPKNIDAIIETQSIIHSFITFVDGSSTAHISKTDMKLPIAFAILGKIDKQILTPVNIYELQNLEFRKINIAKYPVWELKKELLTNPKKGVILNSANDILVAKFLNGEIPFGNIAKGILETFNKFHNYLPENIDEVFAIKNEINSFLL